MPPVKHQPPCEDITIVKEKVAALEQWRQETEDYARIKEKVLSLETWRTATELDLKDVLAVVSQVKLLMSLSIGGGALSVLTLLVTVVLLVQGKP
jgi:hypothetical protein